MGEAKGFQQEKDAHKLQSRRSTYAEMDMCNSGSGRENSDEKKDQCRSRSPQREHSSKRRKRTAFLDKHERYKENHKSVVQGYNAKYCSHSHDSGEDSFKEHDRYFLKSHHKFEEMNGLEDHERRKKKHKTEEDLSRQKKGEAFFHEQGKSEKKYKSKSHGQNGKGHRSSDWISDNTDYDEERSNNPSCEDSYDKHGIDTQERYGGRYCSADLGSDKNSCENTSQHSKYHNERKEFDRYSSRHRRNHVSHDHELEGTKGRVRKQESSDQRFSSDESSDDQKTTDKGPGCEETQYCLIDNGSSQSFRKHSRSGKKGKHHRREEECNGTKEQSSSYDSDILESNRRAYKQQSRSQTRIHSSRSSRSERSHRSIEDS